MAQHGAVMIQVLHHRTQIYLQYRFMHFQFECFGHQIEVEHTRTLYQNHFRMKGFEQFRFKKRFGIREEITFYPVVKTSGTRRNFRSYSYQFINTPTLHQLGYTPIKRGSTLSRFQNIRQNQRTFQSFLFRTAHQEVKSYIQRGQIRIIAIINQ